MRLTSGQGTKLEKKSVVEREIAPQSGLVGAGDHLLQRGIGYKRAFYETWPVRIGTGQFERRRRPVRLRIAEIGRQTRGELIGQPGNRIEMDKGLVAVELGGRAKSVADTDAGDAELCPGRTRAHDRGDLAKTHRFHA